MLDWNLLFRVCSSLSPHTGESQKEREEGGLIVSRLESAFLSRNIFLDFGERIYGEFGGVFGGEINTACVYL